MENLLLILCLYLFNFPFAEIKRAYPQEEGIKTIVIDAGHGGFDPGNLGTKRYSTREKDIALAVSLKVGQYLKDNIPNIEVVYTRQTDVFIPLKKRAEIANEAGGDLFISIHCDSFTQSSVHGATTLVLGRNHEDENRVAIQENSAILLEENYQEKYEGFDPRKPESLIALNLYQNNYLNQSVLLAKKIQDQFRERVNRRDRGVKQQPLYVTSRTAMPAVLVELGFLTNPKEEDFLNSEKGQSYMASAIFRAIRDYKLEQDEILAGQKNNQAPALQPSTEVIQPAESKDPESQVAVQEPASEEKPKEAEQRVQFAVQILTSDRQRALKDPVFKSTQNIREIEENGLFKYYVGPVNSYAEASALRKQMIDKGFSDAFVIGLSNGEKISAVKARQMLR